MTWKTAFKKFQGVWSTYADDIPQSFLKAVFHKIYLGHSCILCPICPSRVKIDLSKW